MTFTTNNIGLIDVILSSFISAYALADDGKGQAHEGTGQVLGVHLVGHSLQVILLPSVLLDLQHRLITGSLFHRRREINGD